jgi:hypothetical protein
LKRIENLEMYIQEKVYWKALKKSILQPGKDINFMENLFMGQGENLGQLAQSFR